MWKSMFQNPKCFSPTSLKNVQKVTELNMVENRSKGDSQIRQDDAEEVNVNRIQVLPVEICKSTMENDFAH